MSDEWAGGESGELVYGEINDGLVFMGEQKAHEHVAIHGALESASTWGELRDKLPGDAHPQMRRCLTEGTMSFPTTPMSSTPANSAPMPTETGPRGRHSACWTGCPTAFERSDRKSPV